MGLGGLYLFPCLFQPWKPQQDSGAPSAGRVRGGWAGGTRGSPNPRLSCPVGLSPGAKPGEEPAGDSPKAENESQPLHGSGICKWFNVRMGFGFLSMTAKGGATLDSPVDVFVHQVRSRIHRWVLGQEAGGSPWEDAGRDGDPTSLPPSQLGIPGKPGSPGHVFPEVGHGRWLRCSPGLLSGDRPCKLIPERFNFPIVVPWGAPGAGEQVPAGCAGAGMLLPPWKDPGKSWFSRGAGSWSPEPGMDAGLGFAQLWLVPEWGYFLPGPLLSVAGCTKACKVYVNLWILCYSGSFVSGFDAHAPC